MRVLSLFDGMACGMIAMKSVGMDIEEYHAYEIDDYAIKTAKHNFPMIQEHGDVFDADFTEYKGFDWLIGGSPCFTSGQIVLTDKGYKDISEIKIGDMVLTHKNRFMPVTKLYEKKANTVKVKIQGYPEFTTTENHPFYSISRSKNSCAEYKKTHSWRKFSEVPEWTKVSDMNSDTFCGYHIHNPSGENEYDLTEEECYILGRYVADGHIRHEKRKGRKNSYQYQLILSIGDNKLNDFIDNIKDNRYCCFAHTKSVHRCVFSSKRLVEIAEKFGIGAVNKQIPEFVFDLPMNLIVKFIDGYISGDGFYDNKWNQYTASTVSMKLAFGLQRLISSYFRTNVGVSVCNNCGVSNIDGREIVGKYPLYNIFFRKGIKKQSVAHIQNGIVWTNVKSINETGKYETVYNIEVEQDHSYTVNNCIVHNCTYWSIAKKDNRETEASGLGWELFSQYVRALHEIKPKYFIYENNKSMSNAIRDSIRDTFGFDEICINSALVSAQNRKRYYWVGKYNYETDWYDKVEMEQPKDKNIFLKDILDGIPVKEKGNCLAGNRGRVSVVHDLTESRNNLVAEPINMTNNNKAYALKSNYSKSSIMNLMSGSCHYPQTGIAEPVKIGNYPGSRNPNNNSREYRIYSIDGKAVTQCGTNGGIGAQTGLYALPIFEYAVVSKSENGIPVKAISPINKREHDVYLVQDKLIYIKGGKYKINLPDGYYIIRKLTVDECKRLQTVPEWYDFSCVSDTRAYIMLGNGWTCDVISYLISKCLER